MPTQRYSVTPHPIDTLLTWVKSGEIAIPEIQRPFVWDATKVRNLLDSLYQGFPVGYLIAWREDGGLATRAATISPGDPLSLRFADGTVKAVASSVDLVDTTERETSTT